MKHTLAEARKAKKQLAERLSGLSHLAGIGITTREDDYAVHVLLERPVAPGIVPSTINGLPVAVEVIGEVVAY